MYIFHKIRAGEKNIKAEAHHKKSTILSIKKEK